MPDTCDSCRFYLQPVDGDKQGGIGECHRRAPVADMRDDEGQLATWPTVFDEYWCGDYEPTAEKVAEKIAGNITRKLKRMTQ
jgi:hypothetical protein